MRAWTDRSWSDFGSTDMSPGVTDDQVLGQASDSGAVLLAADKDFGELVFRQNRAHAGVVLVRLAGLAPAVKADLVADLVRNHADALSGAFAVVEVGHVRIRKGM